MSTLNITAKDVNELRQMTGAGIMDCKKALTEANGDVQAAIDYLRKKGAKVAELRAGRESNEGVVVAITSADGKEGVVMQLSCETDFVAKNDDFVKFAKEIAEHALTLKFDSKDALLASEMNGSTIEAQLQGKVAAIGEIINIGTYYRLTGECVVPYIHMGYKMGVLVALNQPKNEGVEAVGRDVAMQIAAMAPVSVDEKNVPQDVIDREIEIGKDQARAEGKPEAMIEKIAQGKLQKFYKENTLLHQAFVKDQNKSVAQVLKEVSADLTVTAFKRVTLGSQS